MKKIILLFVLIAGAGLHASAQIQYPDRYRQNLDEKYTSGLFRGSNAYMLVPPDDPSSVGSITVFQYLQGRVPGVTINNASMFSPVVRWRMANTSFFLNEMRVDANTLALLNMSDIALVKVFRPPFIGAIGNSPGGAIAVYTLMGDDEDED
jgi:hypothetical protein